MKQKYQAIIDKINESWKAGDMKTYRRAKKQLEKWQLAYGAYRPVM